MVKNIKGSDIKNFRKNLKRGIEDALDILCWDRMKLAETYGNHVQETAYTEVRIGQLINVNKGEEVNSEKMFKWMNEQIEEQNGREW